jgi:hypothetical protein
MKLSLSAPRSPKGRRWRVDSTWQPVSFCTVAADAPCARALTPQRVGHRGLLEFTDELAEDRLDNSRPRLLGDLREGLECWRMS